MSLAPKRESHMSGLHSVVNCSSSLSMFSITNCHISSACLATVPHPAPWPPQLHSRTTVPIVETAGQYMCNGAFRTVHI